MKTSSYVLEALKLLSPEEILKLSGTLSEKHAAFKRAIGADLFVWDDAPVNEVFEAKILPFPTTTTGGHDLLKEDDSPSGSSPPEPIRDPHEKIHEGEGPGENFVSTENILWQREMSKDSDEAIQKLDAFRGYKKASEMYVIKTKTPDGTPKIKFATTNGVLVNKKQA